MDTRLLISLPWMGTSSTGRSCVVLFSSVRQHSGKLFGIFLQCKCVNVCQWFWPAIHSILRGQCRSVGQVDEVLAVVADKELVIRIGLELSSMEHAEIVLTCCLHNKWSKS